MLGVLTLYVTYLTSSATDTSTYRSNALIGDEIVICDFILSWIVKIVHCH